MTLVELIVAMGIFTVIIAVFMGGVVVMTKNTARAQAVSDAADEIRRVYQRFDKEVRYASAINRPGFGTDGSYYVEYLVTAVDAGTPARCTQWRLVPSTDVVQRRSWSNVGAPAPSAWATIASRVRNDPAVVAQRPFQFTPAGTVNLNQQLKVVLDVGRGTRKGAQLDSLFIARNTDNLTTTNKDADGNGASDVTVCQTGIGRS